MFSAPGLSGRATKPMAQDVCVRLARSKEDLSQAFRLIFESYFRIGLVAEKPSGLRLTPHHLLPTTEVLLATHQEQINSTVSLFGDGYLGLPMQSMYPKEVKTLRDQGLRLAEIGCLADRRSSQVRFIDTFAQIGVLLVQVARARGIDALVAATHPKHARLYKRLMGFQQIGELSECPYANGKPAVALYLRFEDYVGTPLYDRYFGQPWSQEQLTQYRWDQQTRQHFKKILERDNQISSLAGIQGYYNWAVITGTMDSHLISESPQWKIKKVFP